MLISGVILGERQMFCFFFAEFESLAEDLKPFIEEDMKIQQVPWLQEYLDMETNYTELSLQKIENTPKGPKTIPVKEYLGV